MMQPNRDPSLRSFVVALFDGAGFVTTSVIGFIVGAASLVPIGLAAWLFDVALADGRSVGLFAVFFAPALGAGCGVVMAHRMRASALQAREEALMASIPSGTSVRSLNKDTSVAVPSSPPGSRLS
jgi:hypothetical protein